MTDPDPPAHLTQNPSPVTAQTATPTIVIERDFDGYFEARVREAVARKGGSRHDVIRVDATPYLSDALRYEIDADKKEIRLLFYSALRAGFGSINWHDLDSIL